MIKVKLKTCTGCGVGKVIWKNINGKPYCQKCASGLTPPTRILPRSKKRVKLDKVYSTQSAEIKNENPCCQARISPECKGCDRAYSTIQHLKGRVGDLYLDKDEQMVICFFCHQWINEHPVQAMELGFAKSRLSA